MNEATKVIGASSAPVKFTEKDIARFWAKTGGARYGQFGVRSKIFYAHRFSWMISNGPIPEGLCVLHRCDTPACVNPAHLWLGTKAENNLDMYAKGRASTGEAHATKMTEKKVEEMRQRFRCGEITVSRLAREYGLSQSTTSLILRHKRWKHITLSGWR